MRATVSVTCGALWPDAPFSAGGAPPPWLPGWPFVARVVHFFPDALPGVPSPFSSGGAGLPSTGGPGGSPSAPLTTIALASLSAALSSA
jgi:hypothetical protein